MLPVALYSFPNGDDLAQHYWWTREWANELQQGHWYPRWLSGAYGGRGSPVMLYYPPVPFFVSSIFYFFTNEALRALAMAYWMGLALSGVTMYAFGRLLLEEKDSLIAAGIYMLLPYHLFDFYQRSAQHEFWALAWVPLIFYGLYRISTEANWRAVPLLALGFALLLATHLPSALILIYLLPVIVLLLTRDRWRLLRIGVGFGVGMGMVCGFLFPFLFERDYLKSLGERSEIQSFSAGFLLEDFSSTFSHIPFPSSGNFLRFLSASNWLAMGLLLLLVICTWIIWKSHFRNHPLVLTLWVVTVLSWLLATRLTLPIWKVVPKMRALQFPIRWFVITSIGISFLTALAIALRKREAFTIQTGLLALLLLLNLSISWLVVMKAAYQPEALRARLRSYTDVREYHPKWWDQQKDPELDNVSAVVETGSAIIQPPIAQGTLQEYVINAEQESVIKFRTLYFPGWVAYVNGEARTLSPNLQGHLQLSVAAGEQRVKLKFEDTPPRRMGKLISLVSLIAYGVMIFLIRRQQAGDVAEPKRSSQEKL